jgi:aminoglycoside 6'-N-acetyltransferase I
MIIRRMEASDRTLWAELRGELWPDDTVESHERELEAHLSRNTLWAFVAVPPNGAAAGFAEIAVRDYANGCLSRPVAFLEGVWVRPPYRRQGVGARLLRTAEAFLLSRGFAELGSDARLDNGIAHEAHAGWGFEETERVVYFRKVLRPHSTEI